MAQKRLHIHVFCLFPHSGSTTDFVKTLKDVLHANTSIVSVCRKVMYWMRSGGLKSKQHQVMAWAGDQTVDWTKYYQIDTI